MIKNTVRDFIDKTYSNTFEKRDCNHFDTVGDKIIKKNIDADIFRYSDADIRYFPRAGNSHSEIRTYTVFPGIELTYDFADTEKARIGSGTEGNFIEIRYCRQGKIERKSENEFFCLMPGDFSISIKKRGKRKEEYSFPLSHYIGITIVINIDIVPECFSCFLDDVNVYPVQVARKLCGEKEYFILRSQSSMEIERIFSDFYFAPEKYKSGYFKVKILELLLLLSEVGTKENAALSLSLSCCQVSLAKKIAAYLSSNTKLKINTAELSKRFHVSQSHLRNTFKSVYGIPIYSYARIQKMRAAESMLTHTELSVMEIAFECGYDNASKFSSAFREITGMSPIEYRKKRYKFVPSGENWEESFKNIV